MSSSLHKVQKGKALEERVHIYIYILIIIPATPIQPILSHQLCHGSEQGHTVFSLHHSQLELLQLKRIILCSGGNLLALAGPNPRIMKQNEEDQLVKFSGLCSICSSGFAQLWCECTSMPWKTPFSCVGSISPRYRH